MSHFGLNNFSAMDFRKTMLLAAAAILIVWPMINETIPPSLLAVIAGIAMVKGLHMPVNTIGDLYTISNALPALTVPVFNFDMVQKLLPDAFTIAILAAIESLLSCVVADGMINSKHRSNTELVAQGAGNIVSALFGGIPATGAIARTAANIKNGGRTPIAGMVHAVVLLLILVVLMPYAALIPMPTIAAILFMVAYNMSGWRKFAYLLKTAPKSDIIVLVLTFGLTVVFDLVVAIEVNVVLAAMLFMKRMSEETAVEGWKYVESDDDDPDSINLRDVAKNIRVYELSGPLFFGAADKIAEIHAKDFNNCLILRMRSVNAIDATAMHALELLWEKCQKKNVTLIFSHVNEQPMSAMKKSGLYDKVGAENFCDAYLGLYGMTADEEDIRMMKENRVILMDEGAKAEWITKNVNDTQMENLKTRLEKDIHKFSKCPNLSDENFVGNSSGVAMAYKNMGTENITSVKERKFKKGLQRRIELIAAINALKSSSFDWRAIEIVFTRNLPVNVAEIVDIANKLKGIVSNETIISQLPFVEDVQLELEKLAEEKEANPFYSEMNPIVDAALGQEQEEIDDFDKSVFANAETALKEFNTVINVAYKKIAKEEREGAIEAKKNADSVKGLAEILNVFSKFVEKDGKYSISKMKRIMNEKNGREIGLFFKGLFDGIPFYDPDDSASKIPTDKPFIFSNCSFIEMLHCLLGFLCYRFSIN